jgi:Protein of unknown function (DUF1553)/Protein of unknown function (DUF1549)
MKAYCGLLLILSLATTALTASEPVLQLGPTNCFEAALSVTPETKLDTLVAQQLVRLKVAPVLCSDEVFVRRVYLDVIGTLPTAEEARSFLKDPSPEKRTLLIDRLLDRPEYADYWAMKWCDILRVKAEFPVNLWPNAAQAYHHWVTVSMRDNKPYDQFVREMLTSNGSNFRVGPVNFYRAVQNKTPEGIAAAVALTFMGTRVETWKNKDQLPGMAAFFSQLSYKPTREWKEEIVFWDPNKEFQDITNSVPARTYKTFLLPDGKRIRKLPEDTDPREVFADWLITEKNPWFSTVVVNRLWAWLMGRGIIHEVDDMRPDNPPSNPKLLAYLRKELVDNHYDMKKVIRLILVSRTYQTSSRMPTCKEPAKVEANFGVYPLRRLEAEVLIDAINKVTETTDFYTSAIPEPFTFIPDNKPAIALPDGSITSSFLELFGRSARATGQADERVNKISPTQKMHLLNSGHIQRKLTTSPRIKKLLPANSKKNTERFAEILDEIYLMTLSRFPTPEEREIVHDYFKKGAVKGNDAWLDLIWALINSDEFLYRH